MEPLARFQQLAAWLADSDIALLELRGPQTRLRLVRDGAAVASEVAPVADARAASTIVVAPALGLVRQRHPMRDEPLAPPSARVERGQPLALLQIGALLVPVAAPHDGIVARWLVEDGHAAGYGDPLIELTD